MDEAELIRRCKRADRRAQEMLYYSCAEALMPVCLRYMKDVQHAEDALMQGFYKFFKNIREFEFRGPGSIQAMLRKMMVNECLMLLRGASRLRIADDLSSVEEEAGADSFAGLGAKEIYQLIAALPDGYRTIFNLYEIEGYSHGEIGRLLSISEGTSKSQLSKAKRLLRAAVTQNNEHYAAQ